jgi:hypothetical protein
MSILLFLGCAYRHGIDMRDGEHQRRLGGFAGESVRESVARAFDAGSGWIRSPLFGLWIAAATQVRFLSVRIAENK